MSTRLDFSRFSHHLTGDECSAILRHGHIIPVSRGWTATCVDEHCPGWSWNELIAVFKAAGIVIGRGGSPPTCDERVLAIHFSGIADFAVEWVDGSTTSKSDAFTDRRRI